LVFTLFVSYITSGPIEQVVAYHRRVRELRTH
jgi:hypothetical protein